MRIPKKKSVCARMGVYATEDASDFPRLKQNDLFGCSEEAWLTTEVSTI